MARSLGGRHSELLTENEDLEVLGPVVSATLATADEETDEGADDEVKEGQLGRSYWACPIGNRGFRPPRGPGDRGDPEAPRRPGFRRPLVAPTCDHRGPLKSTSPESQRNPKDGSIQSGPGESLDEPPLDQQESG